MRNSISCPSKQVRFYVRKLKQVLLDVLNGGWGVKEHEKGLIGATAVTSVKHNHCYLGNKNGIRHCLHYARVNPKNPIKD